ncbi:unnamed protein product, partial [Cylicocyclus nassatus]
RISRIPGYVFFSLKHTNLRKITKLRNIKLKNGCAVIVIDNPFLETLPEFEWQRNETVFFFISDNPMLNTTALRSRLRKLYLTNVFVQRPFACGPLRKSSRNCSIIEDNVIIGEKKNENLEKVEEIYGYLSVNYRSDTPTILIKDNLRLKNIDSLLELTEASNVNPLNTVLIKDNPELCVIRENQNRPFIQKYANLTKCPFK